MDATARVQAKLELMKFHQEQLKLQRGTMDTWFKYYPQRPFRQGSQRGIAMTSPLELDLGRSAKDDRWHRNPGRADSPGQMPCAHRNLGSGFRHRTMPWPMPGRGLGGLHMPMAFPIPGKPAAQNHTSPWRSRHQEGSSEDSCGSTPWSVLDLRPRGIACQEGIAHPGIPAAVISTPGWRGAYRERSSREPCGSSMAHTGRGNCDSGAGVVYRDAIGAGQFMARASSTALAEATSVRSAAGALPWLAMAARKWSAVMAMAAGWSGAVLASFTHRSAARWQV